jgi:hypothetical protein
MPCSLFAKREAKTLIKVKIGKELKNTCSFFCRKKNQKRLSKTLLNLYKVFWRYLFYKKGNKEF